MKLIFHSIISITAILDYPIPPCRSLCISARECEKVMKSFDYLWPEDLECDKFPEDGPDGQLCISNNASARSDQNSFSTPITSFNKYDRKQNNLAMDYKNATSYGHRSIGFICPVQLKAPSGMCGCREKQAREKNGEIFYYWEDESTARISICITWRRNFLYLCVSCHLSLIWQ